MQDLQKKTDKVVAAHTMLCDYYQLTKDDDMRKDSVPFLNLWRDFFKNVESCCPIEEKRKGANKGGLTSEAQEAMKKQIAEL